jgi:ABC-type multidrug transport system fused ATPase/permease subunit
MPTTRVARAHAAAAAAAAHVPPQAAAWPQLVRELLAMMLRHPWLLGLTILPNVITPALAPIQAWLAQEVLDQVAKGEQRFALAELLAYAPLAIGIFAGLALLQVAEKLTNRMYDDRLLIDLQRCWFDRRGDGCVGDQVARSINDCKNAVKITDLLQKELWVVAVGLPAVVLWQLRLSPELLPALLVAALLPFAAALLFGRLIQRFSHLGLQLVASVSSAVARGDRERLHTEQEKFYRNRIRFELAKQASEVIADLAFWVTLVLVLVLSISGVWRLLPQELSAGEIGGFLVNLKLINKPLGALVKVHNKVREGWPAVRRVLMPQQPEAAHG